MSTRLSPAARKGSWAATLLFALWSALPSRVALAGPMDSVIDVRGGATQGAIVVGASPQIELAAFLLALASDERPALGTPAWAQAYSDTTALSSGPAIDVVKQMEADGFSQDTIYRFALLHTPPPVFDATFRNMDPALLTSDLQRLLKHKADTRRLTEGLRALYQAGRLEHILHRYAKARGSMIRACQQALPDGAPIEELITWTSMPREPGTLFLVPSLLAQQPVRFTLPLEGGAVAWISVLPMGEDGLPDQETAALIRYEEAAYWILDPLFQRFRGEITELARSRQDVTAQFTRAVVLALLDQARLALAEAARTRYLEPTALLVPEFEAGLRQWDAVRHRFPTLERYAPELLDRAVVSLEGSARLPRLRDPGFESWDGVVPREWGIEVVEPATEAPRPSSVTRVRGARRDSSALRIAGDATTNQWLGVVSRPMEVVPGDRVTIQARMRSRNVTPRGSRIRAAHLEARVLGRDGTLLRRVVGREFLGTTGWERVNIEFIAPASATSFHLACVLTMTGELFFDDIVMSVERPSMRRFLRNGGFEAGDEDGPVDWQVDVVSIQTQTGPSVRSLWNLDADSPFEGNYALHLAGDDNTGQWLEVRSGLLGVAPGQRVTLTGRMRARNVTLGPRQHRHANLVLTFLNERGLEISSLESPLVEGTQEEWIPVTIEATVPLEAVSLRVGCLLTMTGNVWFDDIHVWRH